MDNQIERSAERELIRLVIACDNLAAMLSAAYGKPKDFYLDDALQQATAIASKVPQKYAEQLLQKANISTGITVDVHVDR